MRTRNVVLLALGLFLLAFITAMIVTYWVKGGVPDALIDRVLDGGIWEALALAAITIIKVICGKDPKDKEE